ncbi:hypothetical protein [Paenibacillus koleovorans]|uniref:hypothetical protein n=1 Tax=Paenibacillus koleovorans TaxID=121608 RepID=UPI000FDC56DF|nr:hypothetical protein [Paenibacillus koleovorans]
MPYRNLWLKEVKSLFPLYGVLGILTVLLHLFLLIKFDVMDDDVVFVFGVLTPFFVISSLALGTGYYQLYTEWRTNSIYLLLSLPVRGWKILSAKLTAVVSLLVATLLFCSASFLLILVRAVWDNLGSEIELSGTTMINILLNSFWMYLLTMVLLLAMIQFAFLCGQLVTRLKWLVALSAFLAGSWLLMRVSPMLSDLFLWMPDILYGGKDTDLIYLHSGPFLILLLFCVGLTMLNGVIFEKEVEV